MRQSEDGSPDLSAQQNAFIIFALLPRIRYQPVIKRLGRGLERKQNTYACISLRKLKL